MTHTEPLPDDGAEDLGHPTTVEEAMDEVVDEEGFADESAYADNEEILAEIDEERPRG